MKRHVVIFEFTRRAKKERLFGETTTDGDLSHVYINDRQGEAELINTLFHEFAHVVLHRFGGNIPPKREEAIARLVGNIVEPCFRNYTTGHTSDYRRTG